MVLFSRVTRPALVALGLLASPVGAQQPPGVPAPPAWLYVGSDITPDPDWHFGTLANGVRYAVRKNGVPPGQVAIRVRIDAGSLMERDGERGYAHLIEHLSFRGSENVPDGEAKRVWQRMGATFGADTNASTTFTQTVYKLDLPAATEAGVDESLRILAGMMDKPALTQAALDSERPVVLAEAREQPGPQVRLSDLTRETFFAGQPIAERSPIGIPAVLSAATPASVRAFQERWYRPERAVVVISGDIDPALAARLVERNFAAWAGDGPAVPTPDFGRPKPGKVTTAALAEPALPSLVSLGWIRPWTVGNDTVIFNQKRMVDQVAVRIVNRRLETRARAGASYITAGATLDDVSRSANTTLVSVLPVGDDWRAALKDVRSAIVDAVAMPPSAAEIDREIREIGANMRAGVASARVEAGAKKADDLVEAVDIKETTTTAAVSLAIFEDAVRKHFFTPAAVQASARAVFDGVALHAVVNTRTPDPQAPAELAAALQADVGGSGAARGKLARLGFGKLPRPGGSGRVATSEVVLTEPKIERVAFANGATLLLFANPSEASRVYVRVRFGRGLAGLPADRPTPAYAADLALVSSGIGKLGQEELDRMTGGRQIGLDFAIDADAFVLGATTTAADLTDQLRLIAAKLARPGWDARPVARARAVLLAGYASLGSSPDGVMARDLDGLLHAGDPRWATPSQATIAALDAASFRALWEPLLAEGPIEVQIFGDVDARVATKAVAKTIGALLPRPAVASPEAPVRFPDHVATPVVRTHSGNPAQAAAVIAWPTGGGVERLADGRKLEVLAAIFRDRLLDQLRSQAGISYTPNVQSSWPVGLPGGGRMIAVGAVPPDKTGFFFTLARGIAADLVARPVGDDELKRAIVPLAQLVARLSSGNTFWLEQTEGGSLDPRRLKAIETIGSDLVRVTPAELQTLAARYLRPDRDWTMVVLPEGSAPVAANDPRRGG